MFEIIRANRIRSFFILAALLALLGVGGWICGMLLHVDPWFGVAGAGVLWGILAIVAFSGGDRVFLGMSGARKLTDREFCPVLFNVVEEMAIAAGMPVPEIWLMHTPSPNAFATGRSPEKGKIAVTTGLLRLVTRDELQGIIAHEMGHLKNRDTLYMMVAGVSVGAIGMLSEIMYRLIWLSLLSRGRRGGNAYVMLIALVFVILGPVFATLFYLSLSRRREYLADATGAVFTRYPEGLASGLEKISQNPRPMARANKSTAPLYIINPLRGKGGSKLWSTHPPTEKRVAVLRSLGNVVSWQAYQEAWKRQTGSRKNLVSKKAGKISGMPVLERAPSKEPVLKSRREERNVGLHALGYWPLLCSCGLQAKVPQNRARYTCPQCGTPHNRSQGQKSDPNGDARGGLKGATECPSCHRNTPRRRANCMYCSASIPR